MPIHQKPLRVVIGCDTDPDRPDFGGVPYNSGLQRQRWRGVESIQSLRERLNNIKDSKGRAVAITWLLRCDEQIDRTEGNYAYLISAYLDLWKRCEDCGDEIGWHPHFWRLNDDGNTWFQEVHDELFQKTVLNKGFRTFTEAWRKPPHSVRMGWDYHNNMTMLELSKLGVLIDFSALPYQQHHGAKNDRGTSFAGCFDWSRTGVQPYFPSDRDFQSPGEDKHKLRIIELPNGLLQSQFVGCLLETRRAVRNRSLSQAFNALIPGKAVANVSVTITLLPFIFSALVKGILTRNEAWLVTYFHADELIPGKGQFINNLVYRMDHFIDNIKILLKHAEKAGREVEFLTAAEAAKILQS